MTVRLVYVDESFDDQKFCLTGMWIRHRDWKQCFDMVKAHREHLKSTHGIWMRKEIHAHELVSGHGQLGPKTIEKWQRSRIFFGILQLIARMPIKLVNVCLDADTGKYEDVQLEAWDRLVNRIERSMKAFEDDERPVRGMLAAEAAKHMSSDDVDKLRVRLDAFSCKAFIISDEGRDAVIISALRKKHVHNPVPSMHGTWPDGSRHKNIRVENIIEDPVFKKSSASYLLQLVDCAAFALLKRETPAKGHIKKYGIHKMFDKTLPGVCFLKASPRDPLGIVRA